MPPPIPHRRPALFCTMLCAASMVTGLVMSLATAGTSLWVAAIVFCTFLPLCFIMVGLVTAQLEDDVRDLRNQLEGLRRGAAAEGPGAGSREQGAGGKEAAR